MGTNGPCGMYRLENIYNFSEKISVPGCMYKMKNLHSCAQDNQSMEGEDIYRVLERRQEIIFKQLDDLKLWVALLKNGLQLDESALQQKCIGVTSQKSLLEVKKLKRGLLEDVVISADPENPPLSVWLLIQLLKDSLKIHVTSHVHSSITHFPQHLSKLSRCSQLTGSRSDQQLILTVIWKKGGDASPELMVNPILQVGIRGEANIARYLGRLLTQETSNPEEATEVDVWLDRSDLLMTAELDNKSRQTFLKTMNVSLGKSRYLVGEGLSLADVVCWAALLEAKMTDSLPSNVSRWWKDLSALTAFQSVIQLTGLC